MSVKELEALRNSWELVAEIAFGVVILGVVLEGVDLLVKWKRTKRNDSILEKDASWIWWVEAVSLIFVAAGLGVELWASHKASGYARDITNVLQTDASLAIKQAGQANELASTNELQVAQLLSTNLALSIELETLKHPRIITADIREMFIKVMSEPHNFSKTRVEVLTGVDNRTTERFAYQVRTILDEAGYGDTPSKYQLPLDEQEKFSSISTDAFPKTVWTFYEVPNIKLPPFEWRGAAVSLARELNINPMKINKMGNFNLVTTNNTKLSTETPFTDNHPEIIAIFSENVRLTNIFASVMIFYPTPNSRTRGFAYAYAPTKDPDSILYGICTVFNEIGISVGMTTNSGVLPHGKVGFFIPPK